MQEYWISMILSEQTKKLPPDGSKLNQLPCLKLFRQIQLICADISTDSTEKIEIHTQLVDYFHHFY